MRISRQLLLCAAAATSAAACSASPSTPAPRGPLYAAAAEMRRTTAVPAVAVVRAGAEGIEESAVGVRREGRGAPVRAGDRFHVGSMAKAMSATVIATLVEEGRLAWTTRPRDVWPEAAEQMHPELRDVTLAELLAHRAGLPGFEGVDQYVDFPASVPNAPGLRAEFAAWVLARPPATRRGSFQYSNAGYIVAASMAERAAGRPFEALMRERLFDRLGMTSPVFAHPTSADRDAPWGHLPDGSRWMPEPAPGAEYVRLLATIVPAGHLSLSAADLGRFLDLHLRGLRGESGLLLRPETFLLLHTPVGDPIPDLNGGYALGWVIARVDGAQVSLHDGSLTAFYSTMAVAPSLGRAAAVLTNADPSAQDVPGAAQRALEAILRGG